MKIGIDIDDTTFVTVNAMIKYADIYHSQVLGREIAKNSLGLIRNRYYLKAIYGWNDEEKFGFFDRYYKDVLKECKMIEESNTVCQKLKERGHKIYFITARLTNIKNCPTEEITKQSLKENHIPYDRLIINASDKLTVAKENGIEVFIEDSYDTCKELSENGIKSILMTTKMNQDIDQGSIVRVKNWKEIYEEILNMLQKSIGTNNIPFYFEDY